MSILKIVGTETELRLDVSSGNTHSYSNSSIDLMSERILPSKLVNRALDIEGLKTIRCMERDVHERQSLVDSHVKYLGSSHQTIDEIIEEHLSPFSDSNSELERAYLREDQLYQHFGFSGGYLYSGHRIYVDGTHPEVCTPECASPLDLVCWEKAGMVIIERARQSLSKATGHNIVLYKNVSDGLGSSWGAHENYLVTKELFNGLTRYSFRLDRVKAFWITFLITRYIYAGAGKLGIELSDASSELVNWGSDFRNKDGIFLLSSRAQFITKLIGINTMFDRGFINTRDIPYIDRSIGRRLHVIVGDANMCDTAIYLKVGMAMIVLMMLEDIDSYHVEMPVLSDFFDSIKSIVFDTELKNKLSVETSNGTKNLTAIEIQRCILESARKWYEFASNEHPQSKIGWVVGVLDTLEGVLDDLCYRKESLYGKIDWITKKMIVERVLNRHRCGWEDVDGGEIIISGNKRSLFSYLRGLDMAYHRLDSKGIFLTEERKGNVVSLVNADQLSVALATPPKDTRAFDRMMLVNIYGQAIKSASWEFVFIVDGLESKILDLKSPWRRLF